MPQYNIQLHDVGSLSEISREIGRMKFSLDTAIAALAEDKIEVLSVKNNTILTRALVGLGRFIDAVRDAQQALKIEQGRYSAEHTTSDGPVVKSSGHKRTRR